MEWVLFGAGLSAVVAALILGQKERRDFARFQEEAGLKRPGELEELSLVVADLQDELAKTAQRITGELEGQAAALKRLIAEARAAAASLEAVTAGRSGAAAGVGEPAAGDPAAGLTQGGGEPHSDWSAVEAEVLRLHREGVAAEEIARRLAVGKGEVKLILNLQKAQAR